MAVFSGPEIPNSNLRVLLDNSNSRSYSGSGSTWTDLIRNTSYTDPINTGVGNETWMGPASTGITINVIIHKIATPVGYAEHPINKWTDTTDASFVLYHFGDTSGAFFPNRFLWYANVGGAWVGISANYLAENGKKYFITLQYNDTTGGQLWVNGAKIGTRYGLGPRGNSTASLKVYGPVGSAASKVESCYIWDRELSDLEIRTNFEAIRSRYGI